MDDTVLDEIAIQPKVYSGRMVHLGAFFGGPLGAGYLLVSNYKALDQEEKVGITWAMAILGMLVYIGTAVAISYYVYDLPDVFYGLLSYWAARVVYQKEQAEAIEHYIEQGGTFHSGWQVFKVVMVIFLIIFTIAMAVGGFFYFINEEEPVPLPPPPPAQTQIPEQDLTSGITSAFYGSLEHVIAYDRSEWNSREIDALGAHFMETGYFGQRVQRQVYAERQDDFYIISMVEVASQAQDPNIQAIYTRIKNSLEKFFDTSRVQLILVDDSWETEYLRL
ncbi:MAG: hypothetical protein AB8E82_16940 [Aureispira sp.]